MISIHDQTETLTAASGSASTTLRIGKGLINQLIVTPTTSSTTYDLKITNQMGIDVYEETDIEGENCQDDLNIAMSQNATLTISNASVDEDFVYYISLIESM